MKSRLGQYCINVSDIERSEKFYADICGLNVEQRLDIPEIRVKELVLGAHDNAGGQIQLAEHYDTKGEPIDHGNAFWKLYVYTDDCRGLYDAAIAFGCESVTEPHDLDGWPVTCAFVLDPDGYNVEILQRHNES
ncbi:VOC family protein [Halieaceae bacterium]|nr:VOC family protein [Halieaceae bacterium]